MSRRVAAVTFVGMISSCACGPSQSSPGTNNVSATPFDEAEAATSLGYPGKRFESIRPYAIDGVFWVMIGTLGRPIIVANGHMVTKTGYGV